MKVLPASKRKPIGPTYDQWATAMNEIVAQGIGARADTVPPGWKTIMELVESTGKSKPVLRRIFRMNRKSDTPMFEERKFRVVTGINVRPVSHYRLLKGTPIAPGGKPK